MCFPSGNADGSFSPDLCEVRVAVPCNGAGGRGGGPREAGLLQAELGGHVAGE